MTNNGKTCRVTGICCNAHKQTNPSGIVRGKMNANALEVFWANKWGQPTADNVKIASVSEMESEDENNNATYFDAVLTFRCSYRGYVPKTVECTLKNVQAVEQSGSSPSSIAETIREQFVRLGGALLDGDAIYLANAVLTFHN